MYKKLIRPLFYLFDAERSHNFVFLSLKLLFKIPGVRKIVQNKFCINDPRLERTLFGLTFKNPVGLAAGFDKNAKLFEELACFGFGFIEVGTVTPLAQQGNDKPRLFRLTEDEALINRMGFNNDGVEAMVKKLKKRKDRTVIIGGNIGKNKITPNTEATNDYIKSFEALFDYVDYFVVNVSSPNTPGLRALQEKEPLTKLLLALQEKNKAHTQPKPILLKIAPDLSDEQLDDIITIVRDTAIAGVIATNTTTARTGLKTAPEEVETIGNGGLSGRPLKNRATEVVRYLAEKSNHAFPIIAVGGIFCPGDALEKLAAGASLVQVYSGFIYEGPELIKRINNKLLTYESI